MEMERWKRRVTFPSNHPYSKTFLEKEQQKKTYKTQEKKPYYLIFKNPFVQCSLIILDKRH